MVDNRERAQLECAIIGSLIQGDECSKNYLIKACEKLKEGDFLLEDAIRCFDVCMKKYKSGEVIDPITLRVEGFNTVFLANCATHGMAVVDFDGYVLALKRMNDEVKLQDIAFNIESSLSQDKKDVGALIEDVASKAMNMLSEDDSIKYGDLTTRSNDYMHEIQDAMNGKEFLGVHSGYRDLDNLIYGFPKGYVSIVAANSSMGKSAFVMNMVYRNCVQGNKKALVFSLEMPERSIMQRLASIDTGVSGNKIIRGQLSQAEFEKIILAQEKFGNIVVDDRPSLSMSKIFARCQYEKAKGGFDFIVIDHMGLSDVGERLSAYENASEVSKASLELAKHFDVPVIGLYQLSRKNLERKPPRPQLSDLRDSGKIEQDAAIVTFVYRPEYFLDREKPDNEDSDKYQEWLEDCESQRGRADIIVAKNRDGAIGTIGLNFDKETGRFDDAAY